MLKSKRRKIAVIIGASRGIGADMAIYLAANNFNVTVAAKTIDINSKIGSITRLAHDLNMKYADSVCLSRYCNVRDESSIKDTFKKTLDKWKSGIDLVVYNCGAILWKSVANTPLKRYDLMHDVNARGCYATVQHALPLMNNDGAHIVVISPPIYERFFRGKTPYAMTKVAMSILVRGLAHELQTASSSINICALWPATGIHSYVTDVLKAPKAVLRKPRVMSVALLYIMQQQSSLSNGKWLIDEDFIRSCDPEHDFSVYSCDENVVVVPRMMPEPHELPCLKLKSSEAENYKVFNSTTLSKL